MDLLPESPATTPRISTVLASYPKPLGAQGSEFNFLESDLGRGLATEALIKCVVLYLGWEGRLGYRPSNVSQCLYDYGATMKVTSELVATLAKRVRRAELQERNASDIGRALSLATRIAIASLTDDEVTRILAGK